MEKRKEAPSADPQPVKKQTIDLTDELELLPAPTKFITIPGLNERFLRIVEVRIEGFIGDRMTVLDRFRNKKEPPVACSNPCYAFGDDRRYAARMMLEAFVPIVNPDAHWVPVCKKDADGSQLEDWFWGTRQDRAANAKRSNDQPIIARSHGGIRFDFDTTKEAAAYFKVDEATIRAHSKGDRKKPLSFANRLWEFERLQGNRPEPIYDQREDGWAPFEGFSKYEKHQDNTVRNIRTKQVVRCYILDNRCTIGLYNDQDQHRMVLHNAPPAQNPSIRTKQGNESSRIVTKVDTRKPFVPTKVALLHPDTDDVVHVWNDLSLAANELNRFYAENNLTNSKGKLVQIRASDFKPILEGKRKGAGGFKFRGFASNEIAPSNPLDLMECYKDKHIKVAMFNLKGEFEKTFHSCDAAAAHLLNMDIKLPKVHQQAAHIYEVVVKQRQSCLGHRFCRLTKDMEGILSMNGTISLQ